MSMSVWIPLLASIATILSFVIGRSTANRDQGKQEGLILGEIGYVKSSIDDVKHKLDKQDEQYIEVLERVSAVEQSAKQAHHRIDEIREHCCGD